SSTQGGSDNAQGGSDSTQSSIDSTDSSTQGNTGSPAGNTGTAIMSFKCTNGAAVYVDDVYKGTITGGVLSIPKEPGVHSIRLTMEGYMTKRYTVSVEDDDENAEFSFPAMVKN
ncbi:MAG: PEGA domain-containing protein, partial [Lachnospiraceae bacterium]|nr:PEGA domain-containing protein [Lachnospiraceae bacterium]